MDTATIDPFSPDAMHRHGYYSGHEDALAGTWSEPIEAEDGTDYAVGYRQGHADAREALAQGVPLAEAIRRGADAATEVARSLGMIPA